MCAYGNWKQASNVWLRVSPENATEAQLCLSIIFKAAEHEARPSCHCVRHEHLHMRDATLTRRSSVMPRPSASAVTAPRYAQLWSDISRDFNGIRRQKTLEGSIDGHPRLFVTPGDAVKSNVLSKRWNKWLGILDVEPIFDVEALAFLAATNERSIELRLGMAWKGLVAIGAALALQKLDVDVLLE